MTARIFWAVIFGFLLGVFARSLVPLGYSWAALLCVLAAASLSLGWYEPRKSRAMVVVAALLIAGALGIARMSAAVMTGDPYLSAALGSSVTIEGTVSGEQDARDTSTLVPIDVSRFATSGARFIPVHARVLAILPAHTAIAYGDLVKVAGKLQIPEPFDTNAGRQFNYPFYLAAQGISYQMVYASATVEGGGGNPLIAAIFKLKDAYLAGTRAVLPEPEAALAGGITVGDKRSIGPELSNVFARDSLTHMLVLSGYNITVVLNAFFALAHSLPQTVQFGGSFSVVTFFILVSGGSSSAVRAGLMALVATIARATHRVYLGERALAAVALVMVALNPFILCFDPSFQLSALATLGLTLFTPHFARWFTRVPTRLGAREILSSTCATQLMVLPFLLFESGTLSLVALPANLLALAPVPFAMLFSFIAAICGMALGPLGVLPAFPAYVLLGYIVSVARLFSALPYAALTIPAFSAWWLLAIYALLFAVYALLARRTTAEVVI